ncbi:MAG: MBL fold metallo-hydrolase [Thermoplasmatota archaeon]
MKLSFVGGVESIGSLGMVAESGDTRVLFDYGLTPRRPPVYPRKVQMVTAAYLTHSHLDHIGAAPWLSGEYGSEIKGTEMTLEISMILLEDSLKISRLEGYSIPYDPMDLRRFTEESEYLRYGIEDRTGEIWVMPYDAGHIPGSTMYKISDNGREILFTGDINTVDTRLQKKGKPVECDVLIMESTYSGRPHPSREEVEEAFLDKVWEVIERRGKAIIPAFAVGRTQEIVQVLDSISEEKWLDGMGRRVAQVYLRHGEFIRNPRALRKAMNQMNFVRTPYQRDKAAGSSVIVTTSGMLDGGPVLEYIRRIKDDQRSAILLTGYQVEDTNGRMLMETGTIDIGGVLERVKCEVCHFDFSAHSGHEGLVEFAEGCKPDEIILIHGDNRKPLADDLASIADVHVPSTDDTFTY